MISVIPRVKGPGETLGSSFNACKVVGIASPIKQAAVKVKTKEPPITKAALTFCFQYPFHYDFKKILWSLKLGGSNRGVRRPRLIKPKGFCLKMYKVISLPKKK